MNDVASWPVIGGDDDTWTASAMTSEHRWARKIKNLETDSSTNLSWIAWDAEREKDAKTSHPWKNGAASAGMRRMEADLIPEE